MFQTTMMSKSGERRGGGGLQFPWWVLSGLQIPW